MIHDQCSYVFWGVQRCGAGYCLGKSIINGVFNEHSYGKSIINGSF